MLSLEEIMTSLIYDDNQIAAVALDIAALSYPVPEKHGNAIIEKCFVFPNLPQSEKARPYAWITFDSEKGKLLSYMNCEFSDFAADTGIPLGEDMNYSAPAKISFQEIMDAKKRFSELYNQIRLYAFDEFLEEEQYKEVQEYLSLHKKLIGSDLEKMYYQLSPTFYDWLNGVTKK